MELIDTNLLVEFLNLTPGHWKKTLPTPEAFECVSDFVQEFHCETPFNLNCQVSSDHFLIGVLGGGVFHHLPSQAKREVAPVDLNHIQPIVRLRLGPLTFYHPYRKGLLFVVDWGVVNRPYTNFKKHTLFLYFFVG